MIYVCGKRENIDVFVNVYGEDIDRKICMNEMLALSYVSKMYVYIIYVREEEPKKSMA